jgi:hypothetical protein
VIISIKNISPEYRIANFLLTLACLLVQALLEMNQGGVETEANLIKPLNSQQSGA